jgi:hypothetical protein
MDDEDQPPPLAAPEPPLIERARRIGWGLMLLSLIAGLVYRLTVGTTAVTALVIAIAAAMLGILAIGNVMLVRALYRQVDEAKTEASDR